MTTFAARIGHHATTRLSRWQLCILLIFTGSFLWAGEVFAADINHCLLTMYRLQQSCQAGADSDFWLDTAKCANRKSGSQRLQCEDQAATDKNSALALCSQQKDARATLCTALGGGAYQPAIDPTRFVTVINNPWMSLPPGTTIVYEGPTPDGFEHEEFFITNRTRKIFGVDCVEVRDRSWIDGELEEDTLDWFAQDVDGNVWYFGEDSKQLSAGLIVGVEGSWMSGIDGARPGIVMAANPQVAGPYRQEYLPGTAEDIAQNVSLDETVVIGNHTFSHCLKTQETTPMEPDALEYKYYCSGVGLVLTESNDGERVAIVLPP